MFETIGAALGVAGAAKDLFGGKGMSARMQMAKQYEYQRQLNQTAIQDRVADAEKAGIHPLYALGASLNPGGVSMPDQSGPSLGSRLSDMGQNISRAVMAKQSKEERVLSVQSAALDLEGKQLDNEMKRAQIASLARSPGLPPPVDVQDNGGKVVTGTKTIMPRLGDTEKGVEAAHALADYYNGNRVPFATGGLGSFIQDGPAGWYYQLTKTLPGMLRADTQAIKDKYKKHKPWVEMNEFLQRSPLGTFHRFVKNRLRKNY